MKKAKIDEILMPGDVQEQSRQATKVRSRFWKKIAGAASRIPFIGDVIAVYYCAMDPQTPARVRGILLAALTYFILPTDSIPDFLVGFGFTDDIAVLSAAISLVGRYINDAHRKAADEFLQAEDTEPDNH